MFNSRLKITEIFLSLQGETRTSGLLTTFIRLTGCPLRCQYCDTTYAFTGGEWYGIEDIIKQVKSHNSHYVTVTGGEPLAQKRCIQLIERLVDEGFDVSVETSGALSIEDVPVEVSRVVDVKTPGSLECERNLFSNFDLLTPHDQLKFVVCDRDDYLWSCELINQYQLNKKCEVLFSPSQGQITPTELADWIIDDGLNVRFQLQLHKYLWNDEPGH
ncbi:MAG: 7-carboxy-7-deazaguanine synthase QueE [bacterium]